LKLEISEPEQLQSAPVAYLGKTFSCLANVTFNLLI